MPNGSSLNGKKIIKEERNEHDKKKKMSKCNKLSYFSLNF